MSNSFIDKYLEKCDLSTVNMEVLEKMDKYTGNYRIDGSSMGSGCAGDPPGYPSYFVQNIWTGRGDSPSKGSTMTLLGRIVQYADTEYDKYKQLLRKLWIPLPLDHPRTRMWIHATYLHHRNCYQVSESGPGHTVKGKSFHDCLLIYPVPNYVLVGEDVKEHNEIIAFAKKHAIPANHNAVTLIRRYYPEYQPEHTLIIDPGNENIPHWWERFSELPNPCPGCASSERHWRHPINKSWCQLCGWKAVKQTVKEEISNVN